MAGTFRPKMYGTVRHGTVNKSFRGSVRAWDSQRKQPSAPANKPQADKENQYSAPLPKKANAYDDDDDLDSFVLDSPPESPVADKIQVVVNLPLSTPAKVKLDSPPKPKYLQPERRYSTQENVQDEPVMPKPSARKPLAPISDNGFNRKPVEPVSSKPLRKKPKSKKRAKGKKAQKTSAEKAPEEIPCVSQSPRIPTPRSAIDIVETAPAVDSLDTTEANGDIEDSHCHGHNSEDIMSSESRRRSTSSETFAVEIVTSQIENIDLEYEEAATRNHVSETGGKDDEEENDNSILLSPQQRLALRRQLWKLADPHTRPSALRAASPYQPAVKMPSTPLVESAPEPASRDSVELSPTSTALDSQVQANEEAELAARRQMPEWHPKIDWDDPDTDPLPLPPNSNMFTLLESCHFPRVTTFEEYLRTLSTDFSSIAKIGQSSYAEVFLHKGENGVPVVLKIVKLRSEESVMEVIEELKSTRSLSPINGFIKYVGCQVCYDGIPTELDAAWRKWEMKNDPGAYSPSVKHAFYTLNHFAIIALEDGGCNLEDCSWASWGVPLEVFRQTVHAIAEAEKERRFEHRDLHGGNILIRDIAKERVQAEQETGVGRASKLGGFMELKVTIIDYTLSRTDVPPEFGGGVAYINLEQGVFEAEGLYQFEIYRKMLAEMRYEIQNLYGVYPEDDIDWSIYCPRTNVLWLHFLTKILVRADNGSPNGGKMLIKKPRPTKKNRFELACWESMMKLGDQLDQICDHPGQAGFDSAVEVLKWCEEEGVFEPLETERIRRENEESGADEPVLLRRSERNRRVVTKS
ncbi:hypothetical protein ABW19_dt0207722 [Dactylella cylindrospora]|nr:hypothetical protein ABW19_dt0207722 [Dactylella cylindrospora]